MPDWADTYRVLAKEAGARSGRFKTSTAEVARGPMLAATEPGVRVITGMVCTQLLKTTLLENVFGYFAHLDPCPMLMVQPKDTAAEGFSKERIGPLIKATPVLRELIGTRKTRSAEETLTYKAFPGGFLALVSAGSPDNLARRPVRVVLYDEVDKYPVTREGDPISLGDERLATFETRALSIRVCSPTIAGQSRIEKSWLSSDQRRASVACPACGHRQFLEFFSHVKWSKGEDGRHETETARVVCEACPHTWSEGERLRALQTIRWHQTRPFTCCGERQVPLDAYRAAWKDDGLVEPVEEVWAWWEGPRHAVYRARCRTCGEWPISNRHAGFQAGKVFSPFTADMPHEQAAKWIAAKGDRDLLKAFINTQCAETFRDSSALDVDVEALAARREQWAGQVPHGVGLLTAGIDTQDHRLEIEIVGWGRDDESWSIEHHVILGSFDDPETQAELDAFLQRRWTRDDGREFVIEAACHDSGGHRSTAVKQFSKDRLSRRVWAIKGASEKAGQRQPVWPAALPASKHKQGFKPVVIGVNDAKDTIRARLSKTEPGPGYMHIPASRDIDWLHQLLAERPTIERIAGQLVMKWVPIPGRANEALDCRVYAYAALQGLKHAGVSPNRWTDERVAAPVRAEPLLPPPPSTDELAAVEPVAAPAPPARTRKAGSRMANRYAALRSHE